MQLSTHAAQQPCRRSGGGPLLQHCTAATRTARPLPAQPRRPSASPLHPSPHAPPRTSPRLAAKLLDDGPYEGTSGCRSVQEVAAKAAAAVEVIRDRHANSLMFGPDSIDGHVLEVHVEATYNINAMRMGSPYR
ncbi:hypothetical protein HYH03_002897 [Edaphochlamys debaryana]|nr:hypothetical protein HYH03_002897 [Edaphochlamys debaryana]|eukprot:KAG2499319.1 hypothetical protein HYH03_002897 [Edaphochlamys debaryana]